MKKIIKLTENDLTRIVNRVISENISAQEKLIKKIDKDGLINTIKLIGYNGFDKILPDYFSDKQNNIKLINELCEMENGIIYLYEILGQDIEIGSREVEEGEEVDYIYRVEEDYVYVNTFTYDEDGEMLDEPTDSYEIRLSDLDDVILNQIFEGLVNYYL